MSAPRGSVGLGGSVMSSAHYGCCVTKKLLLLRYWCNCLAAVAKRIAGANSKENIVFRNRKGGRVAFRGRAILLRIGRGLPVVGGRLAPDNLIVNCAARCGGTIPLERGVVI